MLWVSAPSPDIVHAITDSLDSQFKRSFESYLQGLEESPVRSLRETMDFMQEHSDKELPPGKLSIR